MSQGHWGQFPWIGRPGVGFLRFKKRDRRVCSNYKKLTLLILPGKVYLGDLERTVCRKAEPWIQEEQCSFHPVHGTLDQLHTLSRAVEDAWECIQPVCMFCRLGEGIWQCPSGSLLGATWGVEASRPLTLLRPFMASVRAWSALLAVVRTIFRWELDSTKVMLCQWFITFMIISRCSQFGGLKIESLFSWLHHTMIYSLHLSGSQLNVKQLEWEPVPRSLKPWSCVLFLVRARDPTQSRVSVSACLFCEGEKNGVEDW